MSGSLINLERARANLPGAGSADERTIDAMIAACSDAIRRYCRRDFALREYDELYDGWTHGRLMLRAYPLQAVESVRGDPRVVLRLGNADAANQQARVTVTAVGLTLVRIASGVRHVDTSITWAANATLAAVAAAVNAPGNGWQAEAVAGYEAYPAQDLYRPPSSGDGTRSEGALACRTTRVGLRLHVRELTDYSWDPRGWLQRGDEGDGDDGPGAWRVQYTAGHAEVPAAVQEACACWVAELFQRTRRDPALASQAVVGSVSQTWLARPLPGPVEALLTPYRRITIA